MYYLQKLSGDHALTANSDNTNILSYASKFNSGETGVVIVNKGTSDQVVRINIPGQTVGDKFYIYTLTGGTDNGDFSQNVFVNGTGPAAPEWGPIGELESIPAAAYPINGEIKFVSAARSVQFVLVENGNNSLSVRNISGLADKFNLDQNYPNPFNPQTVIPFYLPEEGRVTLKIYDIVGRELMTLLDNELHASGRHKISFNAWNLPS
jgi:hypothetical protein